MRVLFITKDRLHMWQELDGVRMGQSYKRAVMPDLEIGSFCKTCGAHPRMDTVPCTFRDYKIIDNSVDYLGAYYVAKEQ